MKIHPYNGVVKEAKALYSGCHILMHHTNEKVLVGSIKKIKKWNIFVYYNNKWQIMSKSFFQLK